MASRQRLMYINFIEEVPENESPTFSCTGTSHVKETDCLIPFVFPMPDACQDILIRIDRTICWSCHKTLNTKVGRPLHAMLQYPRPLAANCTSLPQHLSDAFTWIAGRCHHCMPSPALQARHSTTTTPIRCCFGSLLPEAKVPGLLKFFRRLHRDSRVESHEVASFSFFLVLPSNSSKWWIQVCSHTHARHSSGHVLCRHLRVQAALYNLLPAS